ncbi:Protein of unknown function [Pyronema omphalodes CBS 100304]|uniref:Uncharacterized protein n=1 Tax=Pyronema omphalodes (strain CBS 100304) TaxID=1076935 RepID=U4LCB9_PYROM|nr:Protein of unknown function [Pyronema omphalodes CBS 100304]
MPTPSVYSTASRMASRHRSRPVTRPSPSSAPTQSLTTALTIIPCILFISIFTALQHLYHTRRRLTPVPVSHPVLIFRDPRHCLSHPGNRIFNVRSDRNILASAPLAHCFFQAELVEQECRFICRVDKEKMKDVLALMMKVKVSCDKAKGLGAPLPWGTEAGRAQEVEGEWTKVMAAGLRKFGGRLFSGEVRGGKDRDRERRRRRRRSSVASSRAGAGGGGWRQGWGWGEDNEEYLGFEEEEEDKEDGKLGPWFEVWEGTVQNRCAGWVVEPQHDGLVSLEDDDEDPFTWVNIQRANLRAFDGEWVPRRRDSVYQIF